MKNIALVARALVLALPIGLAACGGGSPGESLQPQSARATQPASCGYSHVWLTVTGISVLGANGWHDTTLASPQRIDLLATSGGILSTLGATPLAAGQYTQVRLVLASDGNSVQPTGGAETALKVPSGSSSGFKLAGNITVPDGSTGDIVLDAFDPCASIVATGNGSYNLKPEAQAAMKSAPTAAPEVPGIAGAVLPVPGGGWVLADNQAGHWSMQRFDANGAPVSSTSIIVTDPNFTWFAALAGGGYAATWIQNTATNGVSDVLTQAFSASGAPLGAPITIAQVEPGKLAHPPALPQIAPLAGGGYVIVWGLPPTDNGVYAQRFTATGAPAAPPVRVTPSGTGSLAVTGLPTGGYVVTWGQFAATGGVQAFSATDTPVGTTQAAGDNGDGAGPPMPVMSSLVGGGAVIAWQAVHEHVYMQQLAADGTPVTPAQVVDDQSTTLVFAQISIGALPDGGYVIAWAENGDVYARRYLASGAPAGPQTKINLVSTSAGGPTGVAVHADGSFEVHWNALGTDGVRHWYSRTFPAGSLM